MNAPLRGPTRTRTPLMTDSFRDVPNKWRQTMYTLPTSLGLAPRRLLHVGREVGDLLHLAHFDDVAVQHGCALGPLDRFRSGFHLDHPVAAEHFLRLGERAVGHFGGLAAREADAGALDGRG